MRYRFYTRDESGRIVLRDVPAYRVALYEIPSSEQPYVTIYETPNCDVDWMAKWIDWKMYIPSDAFTSPALVLDTQ